MSEVRATKSAAQKLDPLLQLVEEQPEGEDSPIEQLQIVLEAILLGERELHRKLDILLAPH